MISALSLRFSWSRKFGVSSDVKKEKKAVWTGKDLVNKLHKNCGFIEKGGGRVYLVG